MKLILIILGAVTIALNAILWYAKKQAAKTNKDEPSKIESADSDTCLREIKDHPNINPLKKAAAFELGIAAEQLDRMTPEEIEKLAIEKGLI